MATPALTDVFGASASQTATQLVISKSDLASTGLTATANNTAESLVVALIKQWQSVLNTTAQQANSAIQVTVSDSFSSIANRNGQAYRQFTKTVALQKPDVTPDLNPNDYL